MRFIRPRFTSALALTSVTLAAATFMLTQRGGAQPSQSAPDATRLDVARYDADGRLLFPDGTERRI